MISRLKNDNSTVILEYHAIGNKNIDILTSTCIVLKMTHLNKFYMQIYTKYFAMCTKGLKIYIYIFTIQD